MEGRKGGREGEKDGGIKKREKQRIRHLTLKLWQKCKRFVLILLQSVNQN